jgi:hypothetical protein
MLLDEIFRLNYVARPERARRRGNMTTRAYLLLGTLASVLLALPRPASLGRRRAGAVPPLSLSAFSRAVATLRRRRGTAEHGDRTWHVQGEYAVHGSAWACTRFAALFDRALEQRWPGAEIHVYLIEPRGATRVRYELCGLPDGAASGPGLRPVVGRLAETAHRRAGVRLVEREPMSVSAE